MQQNNTTPITADDIKDLTGEELDSFLAKRAEKIRNETAEISKEMDPVCKEIEKINVPTKEKGEAQDVAFVKKAEEEMIKKLDDAVVEFATDDETLKQIEEEE